MAYRSGQDESPTMETKTESDLLLAARAEPEQMWMGNREAPHLWPDDELVVAAQQGLSPAAGELLMRHQGLLYGVVRRMTASAEDADDMVQETMLRAFVNIGRFRKEAQFSSWLIAIAINAVFSAKRKSRRAQWIYLDAPEDVSHRRNTWELPDTRPTPEKECLEHEFLYVVQNEIKKLPRLYRSALQAHSLYDSSIEETARALGTTKSAAKSRLSRARIMLSDVLQKRARRMTRVRVAHPATRG